MVATWLPAKMIARKVARQLLKGEPRWEVGRRLLDERHFAFRGGPERSATLRTRAGDGTTGD
jgi:hypothetical protein